MKVKVTADGGHVLVTKDNFFVTLAPYFVPIYTGAIISGFVLGRFLGLERALGMGRLLLGTGVNLRFSSCSR